MFRLPARGAALKPVHARLFSGSPSLLSAHRETHYSVLGVGVHATQAEIKKAFYALSKQYHPDANGEQGDLAKYQRITAAYAVLGSQSKRANYNATLGAAVRRPEGFGDRYSPHGAHAHPHASASASASFRRPGNRFSARAAPGPNARPADHSARSDPALDPLRPVHSQHQSHASAAKRAPHFNASEHLARHKRSEQRREQMRKQQLAEETHEADREEWRGRTSRTASTIAIAGVGGIAAFWYFRH